MRDRTDRPHDEAMAELFLHDPDFAAYMLCDVLGDGDEVDLALLLPQLDDAFDAIWARIPDLAARLREFFSDSERLRWAVNMADGWYCVPAEGGFAVYRQECDERKQSIWFSDEKEAIRFALKVAISRR